MIRLLSLLPFVYHYCCDTLLYSSIVSRDNRNSGKSERKGSRLNSGVIPLGHRLLAAEDAEVAEGTRK
jgi:hypothetical protein